MPALRKSHSAAEDARELARAPIADPYRTTATDPYADQAVPSDVALIDGAGRIVRPAASDRPVPGYPAPIRRKAPSVVTAAGALAIVLGILVALFGLILFAIVSLSSDVGALDRSFYQGSDAAHVLMGFADIGVGASLVVGAIGVLQSRADGRIWLSVGLWLVLGFSVYWQRDGLGPAFVPWLMGLGAVIGLILIFHARTTRWLGISPPPQPS